MPQCQTATATTGETKPKHGWGWTSAETRDEIIRTLHSKNPSAESLRSAALTLLLEAADVAGPAEDRRTTLAAAMLLEPEPECEPRRDAVVNILLAGRL